MGFSESWERSSELAGWRKMSEMARFLEITPQSIYGARERDAFPLEWAHKIALEFNSTSEWILQGVQLHTDGRSDRSAEGQTLDEDNLKSVIEAVERYQGQQGLSIQPEKKAELVLALYEMFLDAEQVDVATIGRLVKLASNQ